MIHNQLNTKSFITSFSIHHNHQNTQVSSIRRYIHIHISTHIHIRHIIRIMHIMHIMRIINIMHIINITHIIKYGVLSHRLNACNVLDTTLHACGTIFYVGVILPIDHIVARRCLDLTMYEWIYDSTPHIFIHYNTSHQHRHFIHIYVHCHCSTSSSFIITSYLYVHHKKSSSSINHHHQIIIIKYTSSSNSMHFI